MRLTRGVLWTVGAGLALSALLVVRAGQLTSRQPTVEPGALLPVDQHAASQRLAGLLRFPTISRQERTQTDPVVFDQLHRFLRTAFPETHQTLTPEIIGGHARLNTWLGRDRSLPPILLLAHQDVVPVEGGTESRWAHPPFAGDIADGFVWGRGAIDFKFGVGGILEAVEGLLAERFSPGRTVLIAFGNDEEVGGQHGAQAISTVLNDRGIRPALVLDEGMAILHGMLPGVARPVALVGTAEKGYLSVELITEAEGGHASMPPRITAVGRLAQALARVETHPLPTHLQGPVRHMLEFVGPEMPFGNRLIMANLWLFGSLVAYQLDQTPPSRALLRTTVAPTMLEGSPKENVLPARARAVINIRVHPADRIDEVLKQLEHIIDDPHVVLHPLAATMTEASPVSSVESSAFTVLHRTVRRVFPKAVVAPGLVIGATDARHYAALSEQIYRFIPLQLTREDLAQIHGTNERIGIEAYHMAIQFYAELIRAAAGPSSPSSP